MRRYWRTCGMCHRPGHDSRTCGKPKKCACGRPRAVGDLCSRCYHRQYTRKRNGWEPKKKTVARRGR